MTGEADLILVNAHVYAAGTWAAATDAIAVRGGAIVAIGRAAELTSLAGPTTRTLDLDGQWVLPGLQDAHVHPVQAGLEMNMCDLSHGHDLDDYLATIAAYASANPDREWILGGGWAMDAFPRGVPTTGALDAIVPDRPVFLPNRDHHSAWVNSAALARADITAETPDPADGRIERDAGGRPTGALHEGAMQLVGALVPPPTSTELEDGLLTAQAYLHSLGITGWQDALVGDGLGMTDSLDTYLAMMQDGRLTAKVVAALWWDRDRGEEQIPELVQRRARAAAVGFDAGSVKIMQDGVCETFTAAVIDPYLDGHGHATDNHGLSFIDASDLARYVQLLDAEDFQVHIHALGDRAVRDSLDAIEDALAVNGQRGNRHHLAHLQIIHPDDVPRFAALGVTGNAQPLWACNEDQMLELALPFLSETARQQQYVFGSLLRTGANLAFGSDWPVTSPDPFGAMHVAVNRTRPDIAHPPLLAAEGMGVVEALDAYTRGSAFLNRLDLTTGVIEVGRAADLTVIDADILAIDPGSIASVGATKTFVGGRLVFEAS
ncbi:MAG: amidohydrolase [Aeromicrobium sp.]|nr:amidohydrolase [Aeromicrobium sp.]